MNTPNAFSDHTQIRYIIRANGALTKLCNNDVFGNVMETLVNEKQKNGAYAITHTAKLR